MKKWLLPVAVTAISSCSPNGGVTECGSDSDCKGDRICSEGTCVDPEASEGEGESAACQPQAFGYQYGLFWFSICEEPCTRTIVDLDDNVTTSVDFQFNETGQLTTATTTSDEQLSSESTATFKYESGRRASREVFGVDSFTNGQPDPARLLLFEEFAYDDSGRVASTFNDDDKDGAPEFRSDYLYNEDGALAAIETFDILFGGGLSSLISASYSTGQLRRLEFDRDADGVVDRRDEYDAVDGKVVGHRVDLDADGAIDQTHEFSYDLRGRLEVDEVVGFLNPSKSTYSYDGCR